MCMKDESVRRVLLYRLGSLGDMLVAVPSLHLVARAFPGAERRMLTNVPVHAKAPAAAAVFGDSGLVHGYLRYAVGTRSPWELARLWASIVRWRPEVLVYLAAPRGIENARRDAAFFRACGVKRMIGVPLTEGMQRNFYGEATGDRWEGNLEPEAERLARNIAELGDARLEEPESWGILLTEAERRRAAEAIGPAAAGQSVPGQSVPGQSVQGQRSIAVSVGTKVQAKDWGKENWRALLAAMAVEYPGRTLLLAGAPEESEASEFAAVGWRQNGGGPVVNLCGRLTPRESAAAFAQAELFVGHDSGPMHLAAAVGTPCVAIFAARNIPRQWFPFGAQHRVVYHRVACWGCGLETCIEQQKKCLFSITVEEVMEAVRSRLEGTKDAG
jgi:ADP-heptose:LPS heptosyltransferase